MAGPSATSETLMLLLLLLALLALAAEAATSASNSNEAGDARFASRDALKAFVADRGNIYIGATNNLYQVGLSDLSVLHHVETGPRLDSASCHASGCSDAERNATAKLTDNVNKLLLVDRDNEKLIACGSILQGACSKYDLADISAAPEFLAEAVAANDENSSTFAFIGPQRYNRWGHGNVVYVGTTFTHHGDYRHDVPAISSRNLHDLKFTEYSFSKQSLLRIDVKYRDRFLVDYVYGFNTSDHIYFITVQKKSHHAGDDEKGVITRLARVCISDANFDTYTEVTLQCQSEGREEHPVLAKAELITAAAGLNAELGVVTNESVLLGVFSSEESHTSSVCAFSMSKIEKLFTENIHNCFNGTMRHRGLEYISGPVQEGKCPDIGAAGNIYDFCQVGLKISGKTAILESALLTVPAKVTALAYDEPEKVPVVVTGASNGRVLVMKLFQSQTLTSYDLGQPILQVAVLDKQLIVLKEHEVLKLAVTHCQTSASPTCDACARLQNPYCGWCPGGQSCTRKHLCTRGDWLSATSEEQCVHLEDIKPKVLSYSNPREDLLLRIKALPKLSQSQSFLCIYGTNTSVTAARTFTNGLVCPNPLQLGRRPAAGESVIPLSIGLSDGRSALPLIVLSTNLTVFDCGVQTDCASCTLSPHCHWCLETSSCSAAGEAPLCPSRGLQQCPKLLPKKIQVPNNSPVRLSLPISHVPDEHRSSSFFCLVSVEAAKMKVGAVLRSGDQVICDRTSFKYLSDTPTINATVSVLVNDLVLDTTQFTLYKCSAMGHYRGSPDCSLCLASPGEYQCAWCDGSCQFAGHCTGQTGSRRGSVVCPKPQIFFLHPTSGPLEGGTHLTIEGSNLGMNGTRHVRLNGKPCRMLDTQLSVEIQCLTPAAGHPVNATLTVESSQGQSTSSVRFQYKDYVIVSATPREGPKSGGTLITISGRNFNIGSKKRVFLDNIECSIEQYPQSEDHLVCITQGSRRPRTTRTLRVEIDGASRRIPFQFHFTPDPKIRQMKPKESYLSGGRTITFHGDYFHLHMKPQLLVYTTPGHPSSSFVQAPCRVVSLSVMECVTPSVRDYIRPNSSAHALPTGLRISNISALLHLKRTFPNIETDLLYLEDPKFQNFTNAFKTYKGDELVIEGRNLATASDTSDVEVSIGKGVCNITSLTNTQLLCVPPQTEPYPIKEDYPEVVIHVGKRLSYQVGLVRYNVYGTDDISAEWIGGIGAAAAILIFIAVVVLIILKHKSSETEREYKRIQIQMDLLENNVRSECKQAFAELQTDMTDLTMELEMTGVPILNRKTFMLNIFFPGVTNHPVLIPQNSDKWPESCILTGLPMVQFEQLLLNKNFLLALIDALELQAHFSVRDRINFASLLSVVLANKMEYFSDVLRTLLTRLTQRSVATRHPQLMLRRTETIVEKLLTNWLAICLYDYVKDQVGPSLFVLFKAIKCQIEKGPVDQFSQESRYSLSEDGLLRQSCDSNQVLCLVLQRELDEAYECKVLDCDSISQVKRKILDAVYKNTPFSLRPLADEVDLEWQCGQDAHVVLQDVDLTTKELDPATGAKMINTLKHYGVKNKAVVSLVPRQFRKLGEGGSAAGGSSSSSSAVYETIDRRRSPEAKLYHLTPPPIDPTSQKGNTLLNGGTMVGSKAVSSAAAKAIPEVFLTRLLSTKGTLKKFIDDFFGAITSVQSKFPYTIKWLFDILDECADFYNLSACSDDPPLVLEAWKSNAVPLRFWANLLKNPDLLYDVERTYAVDTNLSVVAQTLLSACNTNAASALNKESPSHKLLFAKEIVEYHKQLKDFYGSIQRLPRVSDQEFNYHMNQLSQKNEGELNQMAALKELFLYVDKYYGVISRELKARNLANSQEFILKLESISQTLCNNM